ncbi:MAG: acyl-CoA thioesterase [Deltaproteobacteria bacterium]|nr:acyl-CoA thioesterase [Deltaproteobacteria bacterium]
MKISKITTRVRYQETDQMGIVYYANFLVYFEMGRTEYLREQGLPYFEIEKAEVYFPVVEVSCTYRAPAYYDDVLVIHTSVSEVRGVTIEFCYKVFRESDEKLIVEGNTKLACVNSQKRPISIPERIRNVLQ